jgi:hypothetical protein
VGVGENCPFPLGSVGDFVESQPGSPEHRNPSARVPQTTAPRLRFTICTSSRIVTGSIRSRR